MRVATCCKRETCSPAFSHFFCAIGAATLLTNFFAGVFLRWRSRLHPCQGRSRRNPQSHRPQTQLHSIMKARALQESSDMFFRRIKIVFRILAHGRDQPERRTATLRSPNVRTIACTCREAHCRVRPEISRPKRARRNKRRTLRTEGLSNQPLPRMFGRNCTMIAFTLRRFLPGILSLRYTSLGGGVSRSGGRPIFACRTRRGREMARRLPSVAPARRRVKSRGWT